MKEPVMEAVRVPPSASMTSQSIQIVRSPILSMSIAVRNDRPMRRWISRVLPDLFPVDDSRTVRVDVARGIIAYSEVTHPFPVFRRKGGTTSSILAVQITRVRPISISTDPSAAWMKSGVMRTGRI
jgi:hypothetical protein